MSSCKSSSDIESPSSLYSSLKYSSSFNSNSSDSSIDKDSLFSALPNNIDNSFSFSSLLLLMFPPSLQLLQ